MYEVYKAIYMDGENYTFLMFGQRKEYFFMFVSGRGTLLWWSLKRVPKSYWSVDLLKRKPFTKRSVITVCISHAPDQYWGMKFERLLEYVTT